MFGPLAYNIFANNLLTLLAGSCDIFDCADDNTVNCYGDNAEEVIDDLKNVGVLMLNWFKSNFMQANPENVQLVIYQKRQGQEYTTS